MSDIQGATKVWERTVDGGQWICRVDSTSSHSGMLTVRDADGQLIHSQTVDISYGAIFGPDVSDVALWKEICIDVIDHPEKRRQEQ